MKPEKTLILDVNPESNPGYHYAKNIVLTDKYDAYATEPGFSQIHDFSPQTPVGFIALDEDDFIVFLDDNTIWYYSITSETLQQVTGADFNFQFSSKNPIHGKFKYNFRRQLIITWVQPNQPPRILNVGYKPGDGATDDVLVAQDVDDINDTLLFPLMQTPKGTGRVIENGNIEVGNYFVSIAYENSDGSVTPTVALLGPYWVGNENIEDVDYDGADSGTGSGKSLRLDLTRLDSRFAKIRLGIIRYSDAAVDSFSIGTKEVPVSGELTVRYSGAEEVTTTTIEELSVPPVGYNRAKAIEQLNNQLWLANLSSREEYNFQSVANDVTIKWTSTLNRVRDLPTHNSKQNFNKSFMHGEVYAFYIQFTYKDGSKSRAFHIPGPLGNSQNTRKLQDDEAITDGIQEAINIGAEQEVRSRYFHFYNTAGVGNGVYSVDGFGKQFKGGTMGVWLNEYQDSKNNQIISEKYPSEGGFPNGAVRHHRFPSLDYMAEQVWSDPKDGYGALTMDYLGIQVENVNIPAEIASEIDGYEILYAKRDFDNAQVLGTDLTQFASYNSPTPAIRETTADPDSGEVLNTNSTYVSSEIDTTRRSSASQIVTSAGNWHMVFSNNQIRRVAWDVLRSHNFDLLRRQASVNVTHIKVGQHYKKTGLKFTNSTGAGGWCGNSGSGETKGGQFNVLSDLGYNFDTQTELLPFTSSETNRVIKVDSHKYVPHGGRIEDFNDTVVRNDRAEACLLLQLNNTEGSIGSDGFADKLKMINLPGNTAKTRDGQTAFTNNLNSEYFRMYALMSFTPLPYDSFLTRELVRTNVYKVVTGSGTQSAHIAFGGDCHLSKLSYVATAMKRGGRDSNGNSVDFDVAPWDNPKCIKSWLGLTIDNASMRHYNEDDFYTEYYPRFNAPRLLLNGPSGNPESVSVDKERKVIYNEAYTKVNDLQAFPVYNPKFKNVSEFPFRVIGSDIENPESTAETWKSFQPLNYTEVVRNKGEIKALVSNGTDLLIHHEYGLFKTRSRGRIDVNLDSFQTELGTGQLFEAPPIEVIPADTAYAGISNWSNGVKFKGGYFFVDPNMGKAFLMSDGLQEVSNFGFRHFGRENMRNRNGVFADHVTVSYDERFNRLLVSQAPDSFTLSYSVDHQGLASFHSWVADHMFNTSNHVISLKGTAIYLHNDNYEGTYYDDTLQSSFIDIIFASNDIFRLQSVEWRTKTDIKGQTSENLYNISLDEISAWNSSAHTGGIPLVRKQTIGLTENTRNVEGEWKFNIFRDNLEENAESFVGDIISDFNVDTTKLDYSKAWHQKRRLLDRFAIVRFKWNSDKRLYLIDIEPSIIPLTR